MIRVGIVNPDSWDFFHELYAFLSANYKTSVFQPRKSTSPLFRERIERHWLDRDLSNFLRKNDVVFFEWATQLLALATSIPKSCKIITRLHRWEMYGWADRINWGSVDQIILVSESKREEFLRKFPAQAHKTEVLPACTSMRQFSPAKRIFSGSIGTLCHLTPRKRIYDLILTFSELVQKVPSLRLRIAGDPDPNHLDYYHSLLSLVDRLSLAGSVQFDGYVEKPWEWYPRIDVFVSNSYSEGLQVAPMEAMASGCYTLSHYWEGADELLPANYLYMTGTELQEKILAFSELPEFRKEQERARMRSLAEKTFDVDKVKSQVGGMIKRLACS